MRKGAMKLNDGAAVKEQYRTAEKLDIRTAIHSRYSTNRQGFGNWIFSHYRIEPGMSVLELGCGTGQMWVGQERLMDTCGRLILSDFSEGMLQKARETLGERGKVGFQQIDIQRIPFEDNTFDVVIANMMLYHVPDIPKGLGEVRRVLKEGGRFYAATYGEKGMMEYLCGLFREYGAEAVGNYLFTLQNGETQLSPFFDKVERFLYEDALEVTDLGDMADYITTLEGMSGLGRLPRETVLAVLAKHSVDGVLRLPKEYGMFAAQ